MEQCLTVLHLINVAAPILAMDLMSTHSQLRIPTLYNALVLGEKQFTKEVVQQTLVDPPLLQMPFI